ncbi:hypothetical protein [Paenibacillus sp.]|uniref:hypothetical protein n=1 Tax=Paenibacillus sp. TaxID=58172 RepID=UPI002D4E40D8|nr:hypothetical protein [Paenibacillus sp.]HZG85301.1 hypothetical protein [Paenibacillus sp.]
MVYKMSFGSILIMCLLCFAIGGQDRLLWTAMPQELAAGLTAASERQGAEEAPADVAIAGFAVESAPLPGARLETPGSQPGGAGAMGTVSAGAAAVACAAGFPLALPPEATLTYAVHDWMIEKGRKATIRYETSDGGLLELTQTAGAAGDTAMKLALPLPRHPAAAGQPAFEAVWQDGGRTYALRAYGVPEEAARLWANALRAPAGCPLAGEEKNVGPLN